MQKKYLEAGEIVSTHGVQGEVKILPWADGPEFLLQFDTFYLDGRPYAVRSARVHKTCVLASLEGIDTPEQGMALRGKRVCIDRDEAKLPEGSVFIADLIGCRALDEDGAELGRIEDVLTMPSSDVYVIAGEKRYMVPAVREFVREIRVDEGYVRVYPRPRAGARHSPHRNAPDPGLHCEPAESGGRLPLRRRPWCRAAGRSALPLLVPCLR